MMAGIMLVARTADLILGVASGGIVQQTQLNKGQYRSWLLYGPFICSIGTTMLFINSSLPVAAKYAQIVIGYILYGGAMSFLQISNNGMMAKISGPNVDDRMSISSKTVQGQNIGRLLTSLVTLTVIQMFDKIEKLDGYTVTQLIFVTIGIAGQLVLYYGTKDYESYDPNFKTSGTGSVKTTTMVVNTLKNPQLVILMIGDTARSTVLMTLAGLAMYVFTYVVKNPTMMTPYMFTTAITSLVASFVIAPISKKIGKRNAGRMTGIICTLSYACLGLFAGESAIMFILFMAIAGVGTMFIGSVAATLYLDCAEYQLFQTGQDNRTFAMSMFGVTIKVGFVFSSIILSWLLEAGGYDAVNKVMADPNKFIRMTGFTSAAIYSIYLVIMLFFYQISEDKAKEYAEANFKMLQERQASQA
jgi:Na+/melibiose symporter-like transporter